MLETCITVVENEETQFEKSGGVVASAGIRARKALLERSQLISCREMNRRQSGLTTNEIASPTPATFVKVQNNMNQYKVRDTDVSAWAWLHDCSYRYGAGAERHVLGKGCSGSFFDPHGGTTSGLVNGRRLVRRDKKRVTTRTKVWVHQ